MFVERVVVNAHASMERRIDWRGFVYRAEAFVKIRFAPNVKRVGIELLNGVKKSVFAETVVWKKKFIARPIFVPRAAMREAAKDIFKTV